MSKKSPKHPDVETQRRLLRFLNEARHPVDLSRHEEPPGKNVLRERLPLALKRKRKLAQEGEQKTGAENAIKPLIDEKTARKILDVRNERSPLYGFADLRQFNDWLDLDISDLLGDWICWRFGRARYGAWEQLDYETPVNVAQSALVHTPDDGHKGRVILIEQVFGDTSHEPPYGRTPLWKPEGTNAGNAFEENAPYPPGQSPALAGVEFEASEGNLYCSAHVFLSDGSLLAVGGGGQNGSPPAEASMAWIFDPGEKEWHPTYDKALGPSNFTRMNAGRWYPTAVYLGDDAGRVLIVGGHNYTRGEETIEVYNESSGRFTLIEGPAGEVPDPSLLPITWDYPNLHLLRNGEVFYSLANRTGNDSGPALFSFAGYEEGRWSVLGGSPAATASRGAMSALILGDSGEPDRVIQAGANTSSVKVIEVPPTTSTAWQDYPFPDGLSRNRVNLVLLPDGTVLLAGGTSTGKECYLFDPAQTGGDPFTRVASMNVARNATHEQALLLPSGQVATFGAGREIEIFTPPYLYDSRCNPAPRPEITEWPNPDENHHILHGQVFTIGTPQADDIGKVVLVRPMAVTHQMDTEQRVIPLCFTRAGSDRLNALVPDGRVYPYGSSAHTHAIAPRGIYMLFIIDNNGVPSEAKFVRLA